MKDEGLEHAARHWFLRFAPPDRRHFTRIALYSVALERNMPLPPDTLVLAALVVAGAFVIFGITGFGSTIIAVPLLAHLLPLKFVIPMFVLLDFAAALHRLQVSLDHRRARTRVAGAVH